MNTSNVNSDIAAQVFYWDDKILWLGRVAEERPVRRYATTFFLSLDAEPISVAIEDGRTISGTGVVIGPRAPRHLTIANRDVLAIVWEQHSGEAQALLPTLKENPILTIPAPNTSCISESIKSLAQSSSKHHVGSDIAEQLELIAAPFFGNRISLDPRVADSARLLRTDVRTRLDGTVLAQRFGVSLERLRHLFAEQMGVSLTNYLLWAKLRRSFMYIEAGTSVSEVALECGFADVSHMTRTFRRMIGISPSVVLGGRGLEAIRC